MKVFKHLAIIVMCAVTLFACSKDEVKDDDGVPGDPCEVNLIISSPNETRGITDDFVDGTDLENAVKVIEFYVFDSNGNPDVEVGRVDDTTPGKGYKKIATSTNEKIHKITMAGGNNKKIVAVVNMELGELTTNTYAGLKSQMAKWVFTANATDGYNARTENRPLGFEMTGEKQFSIVAGTINNSVTVNVSRLASRINAPTFNTADPNFVNLEADDLEEIWEAKATEVTGKNLTYVNEGYTVVNGRNKSDVFFIGNADGDDRKTKVETVDGKPYIVPDWNTWSATGKTNIASTFTPTADNTGTYTSTYSGKGQAADWFLNGNSSDNEHRVYVYENKPSIITASNVTGYDPAETYALIVKGTIVVDGDNANTNQLNRTRYWRIDLTREDDYHVYRNASYAITINKVSTPGYGSPEEAEKKNPVIPPKNQTSTDVKIVVSGWRLNDYKTGM